MDIDKTTVSAAELGAVLGITPRRIRQLVQAGVLERAERGRYPLAGSVRRYIEAIQARGSESDDLRRERVALVRAQRRRIEIDNEFREASGHDLGWQDAALSAFSVAWWLKLSPVSTWMYDELTARGIAEPRVLAGTLHNWLIGLRHQIDVQMKAAASEARRREITITDADQLMRLMGHRPDDAE